MDYVCEGVSCSVVFDSLWPYGLHSPWNSTGQNARVGSCFLPQVIFPTQGLNPGLLHCRQILYQLSHKGNPRILEWVAYPFSRGSSRPRNQTRVSSIRFFTNWAIREALHGTSVQFSRSVMSDSLQPHGVQHNRHPCPSPTSEIYPNSYPLSQWCHKPSHPLLSPSPPALNLSQNQGLFKWVSSFHQVAKVLEFHLQHQFFQWTLMTDLL